MNLLSVEMNLWVQNKRFARLTLIELGSGISGLNSNILDIYK